MKKSPYVVSFQSNTFWSFAKGILNQMHVSFSIQFYLDYVWYITINVDIYKSQIGIFYLIYVHSALCGESL